MICVNMRKNILEALEQMVSLHWHEARADFAKHYNDLDISGLPGYDDAVEIDSWIGTCIELRLNHMFFYYMQVRLEILNERKKAADALEKQKKRNR